MAASVSEASESTLLRISRWGLVATIAGMPLYIIRWHYGPLPTTLLETLIIVTVAVYVAARWLDGWRRPLSTVYDIPIAALLIAGAIAVLVASDHRAGLGLYRAYFIEPIAIFYVAIDLLRQTRTLRLAIAGFGVSSTLLAILNIAAFGAAVAAGHVRVGAAPSAVYTNANYVAMYLEPPVAFATAMVLLAESQTWRWLSAAWLGLAGVALIVTFSKASYLALGVLAILVLMSIRRWRLPLFLGLGAVVVVASRLPLMTERWSRVEDSLIGRVQIFGETLRLMRGHELLGIGISNYEINYRDYTTQPYPHDIWLAFWVELGVLGLVAFAVITFGLLWRGWKAWPHVRGFHRPALWGALAGIVLWIVHGIVDTPYWKNDMSVEYWLMAAIVVVAVAGAARQPEPAPASPPALAPSTP